MAIVNIADNVVAGTTVIVSHGGEAEPEMFPRRLSLVGGRLVATRTPSSTTSCIMALASTAVMSAADGRADSHRWRFQLKSQACSAREPCSGLFVGKQP